MNLARLSNKIIEYSFYAIFILVPLVFSQYTSELFELNKMWITFSFTIIISTAWLIKMISLKTFIFRRTFFDIPILLFLISQFISTLISLDPHISWWGYYSRFNGGFYSTLCYIILYYAFLTNLSFRELRNSLYLSITTGIGVALWGLPAHFGKDPTCLLFRGTLDTACWTESFQPTVRIFSTLGQPAWMAAYLAFLIPPTLAFYLNNTVKKDPDQKAAQQTSFKFPFLSKKNSIIIWILVATLFYIDLIFANTRAGFIGFWAGNALFWGGLLLTTGIIPSLKLLTQKTWLKYLLIINITFLLCNFIFGVPLGGFEKFTLNNILRSTQAPAAAPTTTSEQPSPAPATGEIGASGINITDSGNIRKIVWKGALDAWGKSPVFGTGVETFAFAYYLNRPAEHNLTSEWDFLYNKAHNEYLNYLTTTGVFGLGTYLLFIGFVFYLIFKITKSIDSTSPEERKTLTLILGLFTGWVTILITNFLGFSVVILNLFLFLTPGFILMLFMHIKPDNKLLQQFPDPGASKDQNAFQWTGVIIIIIIGSAMLLNLLTFWNADKAYALGYNLNRVGEYQQAYNKLSESVTLRPQEPVFKDEFALNLATIATAISLQGGDATMATQAAQQAIQYSNEVTTAHPNNIVFWKNRVKIFSLLNQSSIDGKDLFTQLALESLLKVNSLAPTDAKVLFNLGTLFKSKDPKEAIRILEETVKLKPDYTDAIRELGLTYKDLADITTDPTQKNAYLKNAKLNLEKVIRLNPNDTETKNILKNINI